MSAYAALVSVMHIIEQIQNHPRPPISLDKEQLQSLTDKVTFLQKFLESYSNINGVVCDDDADGLESRIADAAYEAEDVIESHIVDTIHAASTTHGNKFSFVNLFPGLHKAMSTREEKLSCLYDDLQKVIQNFGLIKRDVMKIKENTKEEDDPMPIAATAAYPSSMGHNTTVGLDYILIEVMDKLTGHHSSCQIIHIVGMGGIGKTTLARNIYVNTLIVQYFDFRGWVTISQEFDSKEILLQVLLCLNNNIGSPESFVHMSEHELGEKIYKILFGRRYLIVMDDVWSIEAWDKVNTFFPENNNGSRIMVTTRLSSLAFQLTGSSDSLEMSFLSKVADDSICFQIESRTRENPHRLPSIPLQLMDQQRENQHHYHHPDLNDSNDNKDCKEQEERGDEFRILGHPMTLKRKRYTDSSSSTTTMVPSSSLVRVRVPCDEMESSRNTVRAWGNQSLQNADPDIFGMMEKEKERQFKGIELIASENFVCKAVMEALGSHLTNKYSEGVPGARYYGGNQYIDEIETLCRERALVAFGLDPESWGVNVQPYSCTSANFAVYTGLLLPGDRIMGLDTPSGGNTSHGCYLPNGRKVSGASIFFESLPYKVNPQTGYVDYDKLEEKALDFRPKILICGGSSYPREWDYARIRQIADKCSAVLLCDMAQISGLIAAKECASPFEYCDIVTSTTHKSLRGPRGGIVFYRRGPKLRKRGMHLNPGDVSDRYDFEEKINFAVFPALQGGPHNNHIAALAIALKQVAAPEYKTYMQQVKKNAQVLASALLRRNCRLITGGTDNHMLLWDLRNLGLTGKNLEKVCELCHITLNKVTTFDDNGNITPGGVRIGTPAMTSRGCLEADFEIMAEFLLRAAQITSSVQKEHGKLPKPFLKGLENNKDIVELRTRVENFASQFALPGFDG